MNPLRSKAHSLAQTRQTKHRTNRTENQHERATNRNLAPKFRACADVIQLCPSEKVPILVPRGRAPFGQHQESRPLARTSGRLRFLVRDSRTSGRSAHTRSLILLSATSKWSAASMCKSKNEPYKCFSRRLKLWPRNFRSRFLVLTKRSAASGDENGRYPYLTLRDEMYQMY